MPDFLPLASRLRPAQASPGREASPIEPVPPDPIYEEVASEIALVKLAAFEVYERAAERALAAFADEVLGRELRLARADVDTIARRILQEYTFEEPIALVVAQEDAMRLNSSLPVRADSSLLAGDVLVEVRDGTIDARLTVRRRLAVAAAFEASA